MSIFSMLLLLALPFDLPVTPASGLQPPPCLPPCSTPLPPGFARAAAMRHALSSARSSLSLPPAFDDSDIVVGYPDSNETRVISGSYAHAGDIVVVNHGTLVLDHADFALRGNIHVYNSGTLQVRGGRLVIGQQFAYEFGSEVTDSGRIELDSASADFNGASSSIYVGGDAELLVTSSTLRNGFATIVPVARSQVTCQRSDFSSEFVIFDSCRINLANCDTMLLWLHFPQSSIADLALPAPDTTILHWELNDSTPGTSGIGYSLTLDTIASVLWGCFPMPGSDVTFRDSRLRTTGLIIPGGDSITFSGLLNNQHHDDYTLPLADRTYRLVNTDLATWNLYPSDSVHLALNSCVFGELLTAGRARADIQSSICDGSGGYLGSEGTSTLFFLSSLVTTQVVSRDRSIMFGGLSTVLYGPVTSTEASTMLLLFCATDQEPRARDTSLLYLCDYSIPSGAAVDETLAIFGTVDIRPGPLNPVGFGSYRFSWASADSQTAWHPIGTTHTEPVANDTLEVWNTHGLASGTYILKLTLYNSNGDSLEPLRAVYLGLAGVEDRRTPDPSCIKLEAAPNPSRGSVTLRVSARPSSLSHASSAFSLCLYDAAGRQLRSFAIRHSPFVISDVPPGIYFVEFATPTGSTRTRLTIIR